jgi:hypothetical protein
MRMHADEVAPAEHLSRQHGWRHDGERQGDIADLLACGCEERLGVWPVDLSGGSGLPAAGGGCPARQLVVDREDRGDVEDDETFAIHVPTPPYTSPKPPDRTVRFRTRT